MPLGGDARSGNAPSPRGERNSFVAFYAIRRVHN
jgi:hypothetical protein